MRAGAKMAVSLLLTVCGKPKTKTHIRLIREKLPRLPLAAVWRAQTLCFLPECRTHVKDGRQF